MLHSSFFSPSLPFPHTFPLLQHGSSMGHSSCQKPAPVWALYGLQFLQGMTNVGSSEGYTRIFFFPDLVVHRNIFHTFFSHSTLSRHAMLFLECFCRGKTSLAAGLICVLSWLCWKEQLCPAWDIPGLFTKSKSLQEVNH